MQHKAHLWCQQYKLSGALLQSKLQQCLCCNTPVDGVHEHVVLVHGPEGTLSEFAKCQDERNCRERALAA